MNHQLLTNTIVRRINSCIQIESIIERRASIPYRVSFCLDRQLLAQIEQIRANNCRLKLSANNLANLRHYILVHLSSSFLDRQVVDSSLIFTTQYLTGKDRTAITLFRSDIDLEGKISQQVQKSLCQDSLLLTQISQAHYWLVLEILAQLPLKPKAWYRWFVVGCFALALAIACGIFCYFAPFIYPYKIAVCFGFILFLNAFKFIITRNLKHWVIYHLLDGLFAKKLYKKKVGLKILSFLAVYN